MIDLKREIFLSKLSIDVKNDSTNELSNYIKGEEGSLKARYTEMKNDYNYIK
jgi:hypothetical protein